MKKSTTGAIIFVLIFAIAIMAYVFITNPFSEVREIPTNDTATEDQAEAVEALVEVEFLVDGQSYFMSVPDDMDGLELMQTISQQYPLESSITPGFDFAGSESEYGFFVEEINGVANDTANSDYWSLYVNDELAQVGVSDYIVQDGDVIEWRYEHVEF